MDSDNGIGTALMERPEQSPHVAKRNATQIGVGRRGVIPENMADLYIVAQRIAISGLAPKDFNTPERVFVALEMGLELGLPMMAALRSIAVVNGRPSIYGDAALALVRASGVCDYYLEIASNTETHALAEQLAVALEYDDRQLTKAIRLKIAEAGVRMNRQAEDFGYTSISRRSGAVTSIVRRFTIADAKRGGLWGKSGPWTQYPERMLMWRSRGFNLRDNFGDILQGLYTTEEATDLPPEAKPIVSVARPALGLAERLAADPAPEPPDPDQLAKDAFNGGSTPAGPGIAPRPDDEEAERILQEAAARARSQPPASDEPAMAPGPSAPDLEAEPHQQPEAPDDAIPPHGRTSADWINDQIITNFPRDKFSSAIAAKKAFHAKDVKSWDKLDPARQDAKYAGLLDGSIWI
jgi:hypothetical protein